MQDYIELAFAIYGALVIVAKITPTPKDDKIVSVFGKFLNFVFLKSNEK